MPTSSDNTKRIAKNTAVLYLRTLITLCISLYTSRVVMNALGIDNYGINNVVAGVVSMFSIVAASNSLAISRYLTFELGKGNAERLHLIFNTSVNIQLIMSGVFVILAEIIGIWFLNCKANIPSDRMYAANWVFQFAVMSFVIGLVSVPYNATIIAHERMSAFAYVSILEAILKLLVALFLVLSPFDVLITFSALNFAVSIIIRLIYGIYCKQHFSECHYSVALDKEMTKEMFKFSGWNVLPATAYIFNTQGINLITNVFFGVAINAARGVAETVEGTVRSFVSNFMTAVRPQIIKSYSSGEHGYMFDLICRSTKMSYFLMLVFALPFMFEAEYVLHLWLGIYPPYAPLFIRLAMVVTLVTLLGEMLFTNVLAVGKVKAYMITETCITCLLFPLTYILFKRGMPSATPYILHTCVYLILVAVRLAFLNKMECFPITMFLRRCILPIFYTTLLATLLPLFLKTTLTSSNSLSHFIINVLASIISTCLFIVVTGLTSGERHFFLSAIKKYLP